MSAGAVIREVLLATLKVLINLTHDFNNECKYVSLHIIGIDKDCILWSENHVLDITIDWFK
jgi:hypothetical protein